MAPNLITREQNVDDVSSVNSAPEENKKIPRPHHQLPTIVIVSQDTAYDHLLPRQSVYLDYPYHCTQQHYWRSKKATFLFSIVILVLLALFCITIIATTNIVRQVKEANNNLALIVETACGPLNGECNGKNFVFRGIPYAVPPTGRRRWSQPVPNIVSSGKCHPKGQVVVDDANPTLCSQRNFQNGQMIGQENCLYLNIWVPRRSLKETMNLPVIVVMQGEGQDFGGVGENFGGKHFESIRPLMSKGDAVFVSVNYRLGVFGFLAVDSDKENTTSITGNYGLMDQILALQWIKENIEDFYGDPNSVIVYGESSGTKAMSGLLESPKSKDLFQGMLAIDPVWLPIRPFDDVKDLNNVALSKTTCQKDIECLRKLDGSEILESFSVSETVKEAPLQTELKQHIHQHRHNLVLTVDEITLFLDDEKEMSNRPKPTVPVFIGQVCHHSCGTGKDRPNGLAKHIRQLLKTKPKMMQQAMKLYAQDDITKTDADVVSEMVLDIRMCRTEKVLESANYPLYYLISLPRTSPTHRCGNNNNNNDDKNNKPSSSFLCANNLHKELSTRKSTPTDAKADLQLLWNDIFSLITERNPSAPLPHKDGDHIVSVTPDPQGSVCHFWDQHKPF